MDFELNMVAELMAENAALKRQIAALEAEADGYCCERPQHVTYNIFANDRTVICIGGEPEVADYGE